MILGGHQHMEHSLHHDNLPTIDQQRENHHNNLPTIDQQHKKCLSLCESYTSKFDVPTITYAEVERISHFDDTKVVLIDVRTEEENAVSVVKGALSREEFEKKYPTPAALVEGTFLRNVILVPYCTIGYRSGVFSTTLMKNGWNGIIDTLSDSTTKPNQVSVSIYNGLGVVPWSYDQLPLVKGFHNHNATKELHVYGDLWDLAHPDYLTKQFRTMNTRNILSIIWIFIVTVITICLIVFVLY